MRSAALVWFAISCAVSTAASASSYDLPPSPIQDQGVATCHHYQFAEGSDYCGFYENLGEPPYPVTRQGETKLALRMTRSIGERAPAVTVRLEVLDENRALVKAYESSPNGSFLLVEGFAWLSSDEIRDLLDDVGKNGFWSLPEKRDSPTTCPSGISYPKGAECVVVCQAGLTIVGMESGKFHVIERLCPELGDNAAELAFSQELLRIAHKHFPDLASDPFWKSQLN